jgi:muramoyltetrapeptide carboxypeptidase
MKACSISLILVAALAVLSDEQVAPSQPIPAEEEWIKPPALRPGDTIMLVAPAGPVDKERVLKFRQVLEKKGFRVIVPESLFRREGYLAGSDEERAAELNAAIHDPNVKAIFPCRGGYGLTRIIDRIDYAALRKNPKVLIGFSDLTALHLAVAKKARLVTFHAPMPQASLWREDGDYGYSATMFWRSVLADQYKKDKGYVIDLPKGHPGPQRLVGGVATGRLTGGNLTLICATLGTPYAIDAKDKLLFLEDTDEAPYRVDRLFSQLRLAGVLEQAAGVIVGNFDKTDEKEVAKIVRHYLAGLKKPVIVNFPLGHTSLNATLPHGALAELKADEPQLRILENPVVLK